MRFQRALHVLPTIPIVALLLPQAAVGGTFYIQGPQGSGPCWCNGSTSPQAWNTFRVTYAPAEPRECEFVRAAFRIQGVPDDPALMRRFEPIFSNITVTGDPFGEGAILSDFVALPGDTDVGYISIYVSTTLAPHVWSVEAHQGIMGFTSPVADFENAPGIWMPQSGRSIVVGTSTPCDACEALPAQGCPFAIEPAAWSTIKALYRDATR